MEVLPFPFIDAQPKRNGYPWSLVYCQGKQDQKQVKEAVLQVTKGI